MTVEKILEMIDKRADKAASLAAKAHKAGNKEGQLRFRAILVELVTLKDNIDQAIEEELDEQALANEHTA